MVSVIEISGDNISIHIAPACLETVPKIESILAFLPSQSPYAHNKISQDSDTIAFKNTALARETVAEGMACRK